MTVYILAECPPQESDYLPQILEWMDSLRNKRSDRDVHAEFAAKYVYVYSGKWAIAAVNPLTGMAYKVKGQQGKVRATRQMLGTIDQLCLRDCIS